MGQEIWEMDFKALKVDMDNGVATVTLDRPDVHNAFDDFMISELHNLFQKLEKDPDVRAIVLTGQGKSFCAGADLNWMKRMANYSQEENVKDARKLAYMLEAISSCMTPVVGRINGHAFGGGCGLVAACDITISSMRSKFAFSEVNLGLVPATISPYVVRRLGYSRAKELFLTGEVFDSAKAMDFGLVDYIVEPDQLDEAVAKKTELLKASGPAALAEVKLLLRGLESKDKDDIIRETSDIIARLRASPEGQEGIGAFLEKRKPKWRKSQWRCSTRY